MSYLNSNNGPTGAISNDCNNQSTTMAGYNISDPSRTAIDDDPLRGIGKRKSEIKEAFSKKRKGLFDETNAFTEACSGEKTAAIPFSPMGKPYGYGNPIVKSVVNSNLHRMEVDKKGGSWWEKAIEGMNKEELKAFKDELIEFKSNLEAGHQDFRGKEAKAGNFMDSFGS